MNLHYFNSDFPVALQIYSMQITQFTIYFDFAANSTFPRSLSQVPCLLQEYRRYLATKNFDDAKKTNKEINYLITRGIYSGESELVSFANDLLLKDNRCEECISVYCAAASLYKTEGYLGRMALCVGGGGLLGRDGIHRANKMMIERDITLKKVVKCHVIPLMHDIKSLMLEVPSASEEDICWWMVYVLEYISASEELVDDDEAAKAAMKERETWQKRWRQIVEKDDKRCIVM